ncbi:MAG: CRTAC1 family protein, partial [Actinomycetia bacterium]|nr:CRTAC1 family protein [Actinomycetes bacterium]
MAKEAGVEAAGLVKGVAWGDYDNDGRLDLYVSRMRQRNLLYHNQGPGENGPGENGRPTFVEVGEEAGIGMPVDSFPTWFFDYDNDGWLDILAAGFATDFIDARANSVVEDYLGYPVEDGLVHLFRNDHDGTFTDVSEAVGVDHPMLVMGANYGDLDNDGWLDLYFGTGAPDYRALVPNRMFRNAGGEVTPEGGKRHVFQDVTTSGGFGHLQKGHGISFADVDNDGDQDVFAVMGGAFSGDVFHNVLFANPGRGNSWVTLRLEGVKSNRAAIGGRIRVEAETPEGRRDVHVLVSTGGSFGSSSLRQEIGLGNATAIRAVEVWWPGGDKQIFDNVP